MARPATDAVHAGESPDPAHGSINVPVVQSSTFRYPERVDGSGGDGTRWAPAPYIYTRYTNPSIEATEAKLAALERADHALVFSSGMAAITAVCHAFLRPGDGLMAQQGIYGGTTALFRDELGPHGITIHDGPATDVPDIPEGTRLVWMESITNPLLRMADVEAWAKAAHDAGARLAVDATFATPIVQRPLRLGADVAIHSATKYLGGHSDLTAGVVCTDDDARAQRLREVRRNTGAVMEPIAAYLLGRSLKTFPLRMKRHQENASDLADHLRDDDRCAVHYPGVGGVMTIDLGTKEAAVAFRRHLRIMTPAASLGGVETLVSLPLETSHAYASPEERARDGITDGLVRISVGIEDVADLVSDVDHALSFASSRRNA